MENPNPGSPGSEPSDDSRRHFMKQAGGLLGMSLASPLVPQPEATSKTITGPASVSLRINGSMHTLQIEPRVSLLDALRENLHLTGTKKGCDHGQCGACTVHVDGRRINSCLTLAIMNQNKAITTIEGLAKHEADGPTPFGGVATATPLLHPMQAAFLKHDGFQCGYCTPGQIMSAVACVREGHATTDDQAREWMSGNLCRCGTYVNILAAVREVAQQAIKG